MLLSVGNYASFLVIILYNKKSELMLVGRATASV